MEMVNGYVFLDLTKSNVYAKALKVLGADKPVVIKDNSGAPYFVDSLTLSGTSVVITKGGKTITIANDNTITSVGDIQNHLYQYTNNDIQIYGQGTDEFRGCCVFYSNEDLTTLLNKISNYSSKEELFNSLVELLTKIKLLTLYPNADTIGGYVTCTLMLGSPNTIYVVAYDGTSGTNTQFDVTTINDEDESLIEPFTKIQLI